MSKDMSEPKKRTCIVCRQEFDEDDVFPVELLRPQIAEEGRKTCPDWQNKGFICMDDLRKVRASRITRLLKADKGELSDLEREVVNSLRDHELVSKDVNRLFERQLTVGERAADKIAKFGGSWVFILSFLGAIAVWMAFNIFAASREKVFDPYPFILLNLVLSCLAAIQAPIIMMSQNRQAEKDRMMADDEYRVNLKAELEIRHIHAKLDQFTKNQWERLLEIQQIQVDLQEDLLHHNRVVDAHVKKTNGHSEHQ